MTVARNTQPSVLGSYGDASTASNPFCSRFVRPGARVYLVPGHSIAGYEEVNAAWIDEFVSSLREARCGLVVGPHGTGKSTLIHSLMATFRMRYARVTHTALHSECHPKRRTTLRYPFKQWRDFAAVLRRTMSNQLVIVDGLEQLPLAARIVFVQAIRHRGGHLLATSHRALLGLPILWRTQATPLLVRRLASDMLENIDPQARGVVERALDARDLKRIENIRELWFELYDVLQLNSVRDQDPQRDSTCHSDFAS